MKIFSPLAVHVCHLWLFCDAYQSFTAKPIIFGRDNGVNLDGPRRQLSCDLDLATKEIDRRQILKKLVAFTSSVGFFSTPSLPVAIASETGNVVQEFPSLRERVEGDAILPAMYSVESPDVFYPDWFNGIWEAESTTKAVEAPAGIALFGGNRSYQFALDDIGTTIHYDTRFRPDPASSFVTADREFNIASIIRATMGDKAVLDVPLGQEDPNRIVFVLAPTGANGTVFRAELRATARKSEYPPTETAREKEFDVLETVRQVVSAESARGSQIQGSPPPLIKDIETTTLYTRVGDDRIEALQRTASFLVPSTNADPLKAAAIQRMGGRAIDVRTYRVVYKLKRRINSAR